MIVTCASHDSHIIFSYSSHEAHVQCIYTLYILYIVHHILHFETESETFLAFCTSTATGTTSDQETGWYSQYDTHTHTHTIPVVQYFSPLTPVTSGAKSKPTRKTSQSGTSSAGQGKVRVSSDLPLYTCMYITTCNTVIV